MRQERGFTLIELLITILIIGILSAVALAAYNGQRDKAKDSQAQTAVRAALSAAVSWYSSKDTFWGFDPSTLPGEERTLRGASPGELGTAGHGSNVPGPDADPSEVQIYVPWLGADQASRRVYVCAVSKGKHAFCIKRDMGTADEPQRTCFGKSTVNVDQAFAGTDPCREQW